MVGLHAEEWNEIETTSHLRNSGRGVWKPPPIRSSGHAAGVPFFESDPWCAEQCCGCAEAWLENGQRGQGSPTQFFRKCLILVEMHERRLTVCRQTHFLPRNFFSKSGPNSSIK